MGRKAYNKDLNSLVERFSTSSQIQNIRSKEDGEFDFTFCASPLDPFCRASVTVSIPDVSEYPESHMCFIFAADDAPPAIASAIEKVPDQSAKALPDLLRTICRRLSTITQGSLVDATDVDAQGDSPMSDDYNEDQEDDLAEYDPEDDEVDVGDWGFDDDVDDATQATPATTTAAPLKWSGDSFRQLQSDLRVIKDSGFRVGCFGQLASGNTGFLCCSCRIAKLEISDEAMTAWSINPKQYLMLLFYFPAGYRPLGKLTSIEPHHVQQYVSMAVGVGESYKPRCLADAQRAFKLKAEGQSMSSPGSFENTMISRAMNGLLNERLISIIKHRLAYGFTWDGAEKFYQENMGKNLSAATVPDTRLFAKEETDAALPSRVMSDEIHSGKSERLLSFPLVAMQFLLRHFVRCTEFCLVCHCKILTTMEALKPYVCENPLCLYQYMSLGFGPSIEHEIMDQPLVVDILLSFCYAAALGQQIKEVPYGLGWKVPHPDMPMPDIPAPQRYSRYSSFPDQNYHQPTATSHLPGKKAMFDRANRRLVGELNDIASLRPGDWMFVLPKRGSAVHCRIEDTSCSPSIVVGEGQLTPSPGSPPRKKKQPGHDSEPAPGPIEAEYWIYDQSFDDIPEQKQARVLLMLLTLLPSVADMKNYLGENPNFSLAAWKERIPPASLGLFRWIISSNRACIMQADELPSDLPVGRPVQNDGGTATIKLGLRKPVSRVFGMHGWLAFRFASGAPDKEQRFINSINTHTGKSQYPTLFAWHGSPVSNWHSIIREGLNYDEMIHGRAYGNGCYHARDFGTSTGYSNSNTVANAWPQSQIQINTAICLSEIVNSTQSFVSSDPFYVVQHTDWIQTRYLFVRPNIHMTMEEPPTSLETLPQDPNRTPTGPDANQIRLPLNAVPLSRRQKLAGGSPSKVTNPWKSLSAKTWSGAQSTIKKRMKLSLTTENLESHNDQHGETLAETIDPEKLSVATLEEDRQLVEDVKRKDPVEPVTPFEPKGMEDVPLLPPPSYATTTASLQLQKAFQQLSKTQKGHIEAGTLHESGWYLDTDQLNRTDNLYQWIVSLHSFPLDLPLAKDMVARDVQCIVFELRFPSNFPHNPPFVRVVRPRFLPFLQGGGGHVTAGGSICMDLLTSSGWTAAYGIESVLVQVRSALMSTDPRPARLDASRSGSRAMDGTTGRSAGQYAVGEALDAYIRACQAHGWKVPEELHSVTALREADAGTEGDSSGAASRLR